MTIAAATSANGLITLTDTWGVCTFFPQGFGSYSCSINCNSGNTGAQNAAFINACFTWMFLNTDAILITGIVAVTNAAMIAMVPNLPGVKRASATALSYIYALSLGRWSKAYAGGVPGAVSALQAAGQISKASALQAAWTAAGSP